MQSYPILLIGLLIGLALSFAFRRKPWGVFFWLPTFGTFSYGACSVIRRLAAIGKLHGPDAGFAGLEGLILLPILGICIVGLVICFFARPRKEALKLTTFIPAVLLYAALVIGSNQLNGSAFELELTDAQGTPLADVGAQLNVNEGGLTMRNQHLVSDAGGKLCFRLKRNQSVRIQLMPTPVAPSLIYCSPTYWNLDISKLHDMSDLIEIRHSWQRPVGPVVLNEGFRETLPATRNIRFPLQLPPHESLEPGLLREKIHGAILAMKEKQSRLGSYAYVCGNVESIEFIPLLIEAYRQNERDHNDVVAGLEQTASILSELNEGCKGVMENMRTSHYPREHLAFQVNQLRAWAGVAPEETDQIRALAQAQEKIDAAARQLSAFVLNEVETNPEVIGILEKLRQLGHSSIPRIVELSLTNPPTGTRAMYQRSHTLRAIGAHFNDVESLAASGNPFLVMIATDAIASKELKGEVASRILEHLKAVRPKVTDASIAGRADMFINMLEARLK